MVVVREELVDEPRDWRQTLKQTKLNTLLIAINDELAGYCIPLHDEPRSSRYEPKLWSGTQRGITTPTGYIRRFRISIPKIEAPTIPITPSAVRDESEPPKSPIPRLQNA